MIKIWLNHWFSAAYNIITMIKQDNPDFHIIGTNENEHLCRCDKRTEKE